MRGSLLLALALISVLFVLFCRPAEAQVTAATSDVPDCISIAPPPLIAGNPIGRYTVTVRDASSSPIPGATVMLNFLPPTLPMVAWCGGAPPPGPPLGTITGTTNAAGWVEFDILGGGCITSTAQPCATPVANVQVTGPPGIGGAFSEDIFCLNSPDAITDAGAKADCPAQSTCAGGLSKVDLSDAVFHTPCIKLSLICPCTKFIPPFGAPVGLGDAVVLTPFIKAGNICPC
jgi:hypothetical protein